MIFNGRKFKYLFIPYDLSNLNFSSTNFSGGFSQKFEMSGTRWFVTLDMKFDNNIPSLQENLYDSSYTDISMIESIDNVGYEDLEYISITQGTEHKQRVIQFLEKYKEFIDSKNQ